MEKTAPPDQEREHDHEHEHEHEHGRAHDHLPPGERAQPASHREVLETTLRELLIAKHLIDASGIRRQFEVLDSRKPATGAKLAELAGKTFEAASRGC